MIKVGFIGVGGMGLGQAHSFRDTPGCTVAAAADVSKASLERFQKDFPDATVTDDWTHLVQDTSLDAFVVAVPTWYHKDICIALLKSGRPVMTEKPMGRTVTHCKAMIDASERSGKLLMVAHCRRFDPDWGTFAKILKGGSLGDPVMWRHAMAGPGPAAGWYLDDKLGGGPLMDGAVHNYDFGNWVFGDPESVVASSVKLTDATGLDTVTAVVRYKSGDQATLSWSWGVAPGAGMHDVLGPKGTMHFGPGPFANDEGIDTAVNGYYHVLHGKDRKPKLFKFKKGNMYVNQAKHFLDCINGKTKCESPATEAIKAVAVAEAILKAAPKGAARKVSW